MQRVDQQPHRRMINRAQYRARLPNRLDLGENAEFQIDADRIARPFGQHRQLVARRPIVGIAADAQHIPRAQFHPHIDQPQMVGIRRPRLDPHHFYVDQR